MEARYEQLEDGEGQVNYLQPDLLALLALGFQEVGYARLRDPRIPSPLFNKVLAAPDGSALVSLHGYSEEDPFVEIRTLLADGAIVQTVRQRRASHRHLLTMAQGDWPGLAMVVVPGEDDAPLEQVWAEHQTAVDLLADTRGAAPVQHRDVELWMAVDERASLPFKRTRSAVLWPPLLSGLYVIACLTLAGWARQAGLLDGLSRAQLITGLLVGTLPLLPFALSSRASPLGGMYVWVRILARLPGPPLQGEAALRQAFRERS